jgi:hypothetical protein
VGDVSMDEVTVGLIKAFAPTIAEKIISVLGEKKVKQGDLNLIVISLLAEQNHNIVRSLEVMGKQLSTLSEGMNTILKEIKNVNEGITILLKRTQA